MRENAFSLFLLIVLIILLHIAGFLAFDFYNNPNSNLAASKDEPKIPFGGTQNDQVNHRKYNIRNIQKNLPGLLKKPKPIPVNSTKPKIYSWVDSSGVRHFSDQNPQEHFENIQKKDAYVSDDLGTSERAAMQIDPYPSSSSTSKIIVMWNQIFVPVRIGYRGKEVQTMLLLDTGATTTVIHSEAAARLNLWKRSKSASIVADGRKIGSEKAYLDYIRVGPNKFENFPVSIINYSGHNNHFKGLLGMDFLKNVKYRINCGIL